MRADVAAILAGLAGAARVPPRGVLLPSTGEGAIPDPPPGEPGEPLYGRVVRDDVQGDVVPGFNKDHQHLLFLRLGGVPAAKRWLRAIAPRLATMDDVLAFVRAHRSQRLRTGVVEPPLNATWINVAFAYRAVVALAGQGDADAFGDESFRQGLAARSAYLGDPSAPDHPGHRSTWVVGGPGDEADLLVVVAADEPTDLDAAVTDLHEELAAHGLQVLFEERGDTLPAPLRGHEHFGFKDGVSQPGIRGRVSTAPGDFVTPRYLPPDEPHARLFGKPGQPLVWPGQVLLGEPRQDPQDLFAPAPAATRFPAWARLGSFLVCRRLRQDVVAFWTAMADLAAGLGEDPVRVASRLVGRWPSGAPLSRSPDADDPVLAGDEFANNHFLFEDDTRPARVTVPGYAGDGHEPARGDPLGAVCPRFAHIRRMNPRDGGSDLGTPADTLLRLVLRRGIPFGPPLIGVDRPSDALVRAERGLMFLGFAATIEDSFEFLTRRWANSPLHPRGGGHDPIMGQRDRGGDRTRHLDVPTQAGPRRVTLDAEWVIPSGGGYFFAPTVSAVADVLGRA